MEEGGSVWGPDRLCLCFTYKINPTVILKSSRNVGERLKKMYTCYVAIETLGFKLMKKLSNALEK